MENGVRPGDFDTFEIGKLGGIGDGYCGEEVRRARGRGVLAASVGVPASAIGGLGIRARGGGGKPAARASWAR